MKLTWRTEIAHVLASAMEASWLSTVMLVIGFGLADAHAAPVGLSLFVLLYATRFLAIRMVAAQIEVSRGRLLIVYLAAGSMLLALKIQNYPGYSWLSLGWLRQMAIDITNLGPALGAVSLTVGVVVYAWWRGSRVSTERQHPIYLFRQFQLGLVVMLVFAFLANRAGKSAQFVPWIFWFFFWGLLAVAVSRLEDIARNRRSPVQGYWLPIVTTVTLLVLVGGGIVSLVYSREMIDALRSLLQPIGAIFDILLFLLAIPIGYLVQFLVWLLKPLLGPLLNELAKRMSEFQMPASPLEKAQEQTNPAHLPAALQDALKWIVIALVIIGLFMLLARSIRRRLVDVDDDVEEIHESVWGQANLWGVLKALWRRLLARLGWRRRKAKSQLAAPTTEEERAAHSIRQIYLRLMEMAAAMGRPRPLACTPYEYLTDLSGLLPANTDDLTAITEAYVRARYGGVSEAAEVGLVQQAWQRVKSELGREARERRARRQITS